MIDVFSFPCACRSFMEITSANRKFVDKKILWRSTVGFDNDWLDFLSAKMIYLSVRIEKYLCTLISSRDNYTFLVTKTHFKNMTYELVPFKRFCHAFYCQRDSKS